MLELVGVSWVVHDSTKYQALGFMLTAELISSNGYVIAKSSQPSMLRFRSLLVRLMRAIFMGIPLLLGITEETQKITIPILKHKEGYPRTEAIRISMVPQAGTSFVPQLYEGKIIINSQLPWSKEIVRRWKWTFCVWTSIHIYIMLLIILVRCFTPLIFPITTPTRTIPTDRGDEQEVTTTEVRKEPRVREGRKEEREVSEALRRWKQSRSERKAMLLRGVSPASSTSNITREETFVAPTTTTEDVGDSESVTFGGSTE
ncbi:seipin-1 [Rhododendron vialii]|uniref:seipin-1 n=1 Tax=Rhododendron vialii TaxID=182163 RepID=UPI00265F17C4|nr:seipin-1 [Rhododendron vialii]